MNEDMAAGAVGHEVATTRQDADKVLEIEVGLDSVVNGDPVHKKVESSAGMIWFSLFSAARLKFKDIKDGAFSKILEIPPQYVRAHMELQRYPNLMLRLNLLDLFNIPWNYNLMMMAIGEKEASVIHNYVERYSKLSKMSRSVVKLHETGRLEKVGADDGMRLHAIVGHYRGPNRFWLDCVREHIKPQTGWLHDKELAEAIDAQPTTMCAFLSDRADLRTDQKIKLLERSRVALNYISLDALMPTTVRKQFRCDRQYIRFLTAIIENRDQGPSLHRSMIRMVTREQQKVAARKDRKLRPNT